MSDKTPCHVLFYGGSITCGGITTGYEKSWPYLTFEGLKKRFPTREMTAYNASISGTGSFLGACRFRSQVLEHFVPDIAFIEFSVNDGGDCISAPDLVYGGMEYIVRELIAANPQVSIIFVYTAIQSRGGARQIDGEIAAAYGIHEIDLTKTMFPMWDADPSSLEKLLPDGVHPNDDGHALYAKLVLEAMQNAPDGMLTPARMAETPVAPRPLTNPRLIPCTECYDAEGFTLQEIKDDDSIKHVPATVEKLAYCSDKPGSSLKVDFEGNHFALYHRIGYQCGRCTVSFDGGEPERVEMLHAYPATYHDVGEIVSFYRKMGLPDGRHTATVTLLADKDERSSGTYAEIVGFFVG